jgi:very-short-patch-repair endonuclease
MTLPEVLLWQEFRRGRLKGCRFRRQHPIGPYILDFFCSDAGLAIEVDGMGHSHDAQARHDQRRDCWLREKGIVVIRIAAADVLRDDTRNALLTWIEHRAAPAISGRIPAPSTACGGPPPPPCGGGSNWER